MPVMTLMVGPTGCGKTTWRRKHLNGTPCVSPDDLILGKFTPRKCSHAWAHARQQALEMLSEEESFAVDAQFIDRKARRDWVNMARGYGYTVRLVVFLTPWRQLLKNHKRRGTRGGYGKVPYSVILRNYQEFVRQLGEGGAFIGPWTVTWVRWRS